MSVAAYAGCRHIRFRQDADDASLIAAQLSHIAYAAAMIIFAPAFRYAASCCR